MELERLTDFSYETRKTLDFNDLTEPEKVKEAIEEARETKEDVLVKHNRFEQTLVTWNDKLGEVQISKLQPVASYTLKEEEADS